VTALAFVLASLMWGSSFLFIKLGLDGFTPLGLVATRLVIGSVFLIAYVRLRRLPWSGDARFWIGGAGIGILSSAIPFFLIAWGERTIESGIASVLTSTTPLFSLVLAPLVYRPDRMSGIPMLGVLVGFAGAIVVVWGGGTSGTLAGMLAVLVAALTYALGGLFMSRFMHMYHFVSVTAVSTVAAAGVVGAIAIPAGQIDLDRPGAVPWVSVTALGLLGTGVALVLFMHVLREWGPTRSSMITYAIPPVGVLLGTLVRDEPLTWRLVVGGALIVIGVFATNRRRRTPTPTDATSTPSAPAAGMTR
jgi:drug/metabolite transporter (DMT)-like permease